jgi:hypothetical protein
MRLSKRKAIGTIVALLFMLLVFVSGLGVYYIISFQTQEYRVTFSAIERIDFDRGLEDLEIIGNPFSYNDQLNMTVINTGSTDTKITFVGVIDPETEKLLCMNAGKYYEPIENMLLRPHQNRTIPINQTFSHSYNGTKSYKIQLITSRGTIIEHQFPRPVPPPFEIMRILIGPFHFEFDSESFSYTYGVETIPVGAWEMYDNATNLVFNVKITNFGEESIEIIGQSYLELIIHEVYNACTPENRGCYESEIYFYLVNSSSTPSNLVSYNNSSPIVVEPDKSTILKFASNESYKDFFHEPGILQGYKIKGGDGNFHNNSAGTENLLWSFIALFWKYPNTNSTYGKTIPFTAVHLREYDPTG